MAQTRTERNAYVLDMQGKMWSTRLGDKGMAMVTRSARAVPRGTVFFTNNGKLYMASANEILNVIAQIPDNVGSTLIVGHNPGFHELCLKLSKTGDKKLIEVLRQNAAIGWITAVMAAVGASLVTWMVALVLPVPPSLSVADSVTT